MELAGNRRRMDLPLSPLAAADTSSGNGAPGTRSMCRTVRRFVPATDGAECELFGFSVVRLAPFGGGPLAKATVLQRNRTVRSPSTRARSPKQPVVRRHVASDAVPPQRPMSVPMLSSSRILAIPCSHADFQPRRRSRSSHRNTGFRRCFRRPERCCVSKVPKAAPGAWDPCFLDLPERGNEPGERGSNPSSRRSADGRSCRARPGGGAR